MNPLHLDAKGYYRVSVNGQWKKAHRVIMEEYLIKTDPLSKFLDNGKLLKKILVHHIDGNKLNNEISNLICLTPKEHSAIHLDKYPSMTYSEKQKMWHSDLCMCGNIKYLYSTKCRSCDFKERKGRIIRRRYENVKSKNK